MLRTRAAVTLAAGLVLLLLWATPSAATARVPTGELTGSVDTIHHTLAGPQAPEVVAGRTGGPAHPPPLPAAAAPDTTGPAPERCALRRHERSSAPPLLRVVAPVGGRAPPVGPGT